MENSKAVFRNENFNTNISIDLNKWDSIEQHTAIRNWAMQAGELAYDLETHEVCFVRFEHYNNGERSIWITGDNGTTEFAEININKSF